MLRLAVAFGALVLAVSLLSPTIASVGDAVEEFEFRREMPWKLWKWDTEVQPPRPTTCDLPPMPAESEVTDWPERLKKDEPFSLGGHVVSPKQNDQGLVGVVVDLYLNETKEEPGIYLGTTATDKNGRFVLENQSFPFELQAKRYHIVANSHEHREGCYRYLEHWSDPEMEVTADTNLTMDAPSRAVVGRPINVSGVLLDHVGAPVTHQTVRLAVGDERVDVETDDEGRFSWNGTIDRPGEYDVVARFEGNDHYSGSEARSNLVVSGEDVRIPAAEGEGGLLVQRSRPAVIEGQVVLPEGRAYGETVTVRFDGIQVVACDGCPPGEEFEARVASDGSFTAGFHVPSTAKPGAYGFTVSGGGLEKAVDFGLTLVVPTALALDLENGGAFEPRYTGEARLVDDRGEPVTAPLALATAAGWVPLQPGADGVARFSADAACGRQSARVLFNGTGELQPAEAQGTVVVCPLATYLSPLGVPWWAWAAGAVVLTILALGARSWWLARAPTISRGPPLTLAFLDDDGAPGLVGVGEPVTLEVRLESPLPPGHTLRVGRHGAMETVAIGDALQARQTIVPAHLGRLAVRAEIVDAKGRALTRRTEFLRVVRYAEEIEERYRALKHEGIGAGADVVSPRDFERWLRQHAQDLDPDVARRLIAIFEEADYSPRDVGRRELLGFMSAERRLQGVGRPAR